MINLLGLGRNKPKGVKVTIEYCPKNITLYKIKRLSTKHLLLFLRNLRTTRLVLLIKK